MNKLFNPNKLLLQELQTMSIAPGIISESSAKNWVKIPFTDDDIDGNFRNKEVKTEIEIRRDMVDFFSKNKLRNKIIEETGISRYSVNISYSI